MRRIGVLGGSFNPVHNAHLLLAEQAREALDLERVVFIPAKRPPHKRASELASAADRLRMARLAVAANAYFQVSNIELRRRGRSYTIDTVRSLRRRFGKASEIFFLIGADTVGELPTWRDIGELARLCRFVPFSRPGVPKPKRKDLAAAVGHEEARAILKRMTPMPLLDISASDIRARVAAGRSIRYLVPDAVADTILCKGLYRNAQPPRKATARKRRSCRA